MTHSGRTGIPALTLRRMCCALALASTLLMTTGAVARYKKTPVYGERVLYNFCSLQNCADGYWPMASLVRDAAGNFYGTTWAGGSAGNGTVFKLDTHGKETVLYNFTGGADGGILPAGVIRDKQGNLYGTTEAGGDPSCTGGYGCGVVFKVDTAGKETVLHSFVGGTDGMAPLAGLIMDTTGSLYGTTSEGGDLNCGLQYGCGTVFKVDTNGKETVLYSFPGVAGGYGPVAPVIRDASGNLYGTTESGGPGEWGTVFRLDTTGKATILYGFQGPGDGEVPTAGLIMDRKGNLYGTTSGGGNTTGNVFKLSPEGKETVLHNFWGGYDGANPYAPLIMDPKGNLYGTTENGGALNEGTVFRISKNRSETVLRRFAGGAGAAPLAGLVQDSRGRLYGTTMGGGSGYCNGLGCGVIFELIP